MKSQFQIIFIALLTMCITINSQDWKRYPYSPEGSVISFPADEGRHPNEAIEWWYVAGHVTGNATNIHYSFMLAYFVFPNYGYDGFRILSLSNDDTGEYYSETQSLNFLEMGLDSLNIQALLISQAIEQWTHKKQMDGNLIPFEYDISATGIEGSIDFNCVSLKPPLIPCDSGYFKLGGEGYTHYYSLTMNDIVGTINFKGTEEDVTGTAWIDKQYGDFNPGSAERYEWLYVQLSNGMDMNIWNVFTGDNQLPGDSTFRYLIVYVDSVNQYTTQDFKLERLNYHYMPDSAMCYAQKWRLTSPENQMDLHISTLHNHTEVQLPFRFFEGPTTIYGTVNGLPVEGKGFAELLKSYEKPHLSIINPSGSPWNDTIPISWQLHNPDFGRPLHYDLDYSKDQQLTFSTIAQGLTDTSYFWNNPPLNTGDSCWFRVTAYSIDSTLINVTTSYQASVYSLLDTTVEVSQLKDPNTKYIRLFPNPANNLLTIEFKQSGTNTIEITSINGKLILCREELGTIHQLDLSSFQKGIYFITIRSKDFVTTEKILKL